MILQTDSMNEVSVVYLEADGLNSEISNDSISKGDIL